MRHVLNAIEGYLITGYADGGDNPNKQLQLVEGAVEDAINFLEKHEDTQHRFNKVGDLVEEFETRYGLELLPTVHWIIKRGDALTNEEVIRKTYACNKRKQQFTERQITLALEMLMKKGWLELL